MKGFLPTPRALQDGFPFRNHRTLAEVFELEELLQKYGSGWNSSSRVPATDRYTGWPD